MARRDWETMEAKCITVICAILVVLFTVTGCVLPIRNTFYKPFSETGNLTSNLCGGRVGPYDTIMFAHGQLTIKVFAYRETQNSANVTLILWLDIPADKEVEVASKDLELRVDNKTMQYEFTELESSNYGDDVSKDRTRPFQLRLSGTPYQKNILKCRFPLQGNKFSVKLPDVAYDGNQIKLGVIDFNETSEWAITPANC
jgi:hypothetical protein